ncbi:unnamed protein product [Macrosiphum euphorbiae]|uniref:MIF4G domain-containing protein n=1 Tax=Macrosiphum euphorbiae TaxID=13131 RepID=A0AAV0Y2L8_9HEMI|nr:unnamed protein product [Macrosiphum euphorbiae]
MKNDNMVPKKCLSVVLNNFLFDFQKRSICNCRFIGELFKNGAFPEKYILKCIGDLGKEKNDNNYELQMHCLCIILQSVGLILSKTSYDLNKKINKLVSSMENYGMSSTLKCLIKKLKIMNSKGWMDEEPVKFAGTNYNAYCDLPPHMQMVYRVRSKKIMSDWAYDESRDHRLNVVNNYKIERSVEDLQEKLSTPICSISSEQRSVKQITPFTKIGGGRVVLIPTLMLLFEIDSLEIGGVGFVGEVGCGSSCESTSKRFDVKNNFLLFCIFGEFCSEEEEERFLLLLL